MKKQHFSYVHVVLLSAFFVATFVLLFIYHHGALQEHFDSFTPHENGRKNILTLFKQREINRKFSTTKQKIATTLNLHPKQTIDTTKPKIQTILNSHPKQKAGRKQTADLTKKITKINVIKVTDQPPKARVTWPKNDNINNLCDPTKTFKGNTKILSYVTFGPNPAYSESIPTIIGYKQNSSFFRDWTIRIYHDGRIAKNILKIIADQKDVQLCNGHNLPRYGNLSSIFGMYWRFVPMADPSVDVFCSRDLDSAIMLREEDAMMEFMGSEAILHTMRDHRFHHIPMLGGMWCYKNKLNREIGRYYLEGIIEMASHSKSREDQTILNKVIWKHAINSLGNNKVMQHDSYHCRTFRNTRPFPKKRRPDDWHVGRPGHWRTYNKNMRKYLVCPVECRPNYGKDWIYC